MSSRYQYVLFMSKDLTFSLSMVGMIATNAQRLLSAPLTPWHHWIEHMHYSSILLH